MRMFLFSAAVSLASFSPAALASDVFVVDPAGPLTSIQDAVDAASTGDIVLVRSGVYTGDVIVDGVGLTLVGEGSCQIRERIEVSNVPANQWALLAGLRLRPRTSMVLSSAIGAIDIKDCAGRVRVVDCNILGATGQVFASGPFVESGGPGVQATRCADVALIDVTVRGGLGMVTVTIIGGTGGAGVHLDSVNRATIMRTVTRGGDGGHGFVAGSQGVFNFQSVFLGGGFGLGVGFRGPGYCDGVPGSPFITGQPMQLLDGHPSRLEIPLVVREGQPFMRRVDERRTSARPLITLRTGL